MSECQLLRQRASASQAVGTGEAAAWITHLDDMWSLKSHFLFQRCLGVWIQWCEQVRGHFEAEEGHSLLCSVHHWV